LPLCRATVTCLVRRLSSAAGRAPALALGAVALVLGLPPLLYRASTVAAADLGPALARPEIARSVVIGAALPCVAAGFTLSISSGVRKQLGVELAGAPVRLLDRALATLVAPVASLVVLAVPTALAVLLPLGEASPGGAVSALALFVTLGGVVGCSAAGATALRQAFSREGALARGALALGTGALVTGGAAPLDPAARALAGTTGPGSSLLIGTVAAVAGLTGWVLLGECEPRQRAGRSRSCSIARRRGTAVAHGAFLLLVRRRDVRSAGIGALVIGCAGLIVARLEDAPAPTGALLAAAGAAVTLAPIGLAVSGATVDGREVWETVPCPAGEVAFGWLLASFTIVGTTSALVVGLSLETGALHLGDVLRVLALCTGAWACAVGAGAVVPWRRIGIAEQGVSLGVFGLLVASASFLTGRVGPWATGMGAPTPVAASVMVGMLVCAALGCLTARIAGRR
jgi:hypothetical protein